MLDTTHDALLLPMSGDAELWQISWISLKTTGLALLIATPLAVAMAYGIAMPRFPGRRIAVWPSQAALSLAAILLAFTLDAALSGALIALVLAINAVLRLLQSDTHAPRRIA